MSARGWWIALSAVGLAAVLWIVLAVRGPVSGRAPARRSGAADGAAEDGATASGRVRVAVRALPLGSVPEWLLELRDSTGSVRQQSGSGERELVLDSLPEGSARCSVRARGFVGESSGVEIGQDAEAVLTLRQFGRVAGTVRCDGAPVSGLLVRIAMPAELASLRLEVTPEERGAGTEQAVETDSSGRYRFDRVPPRQHRRRRW